MMDEQPNPFGDPHAAPPAAENPYTYSGGYQGMTAEQLRQKEIELERREQELGRREQQLEYKERKVGELQVKLEELDKPPNWPSFRPIIRMNIREDIPDKNKFLAKRGYFAWLLCTITYLFNIVAVLALVIVDPDRATDFGVGLAVGIIGPPVAFVFWYRPLYAALRRGRTIPFLFFFFCYTFHLACCIVYCIGFANSGGAGYILAFMYMASSGTENDGARKGAGVVCLISAIIWTIQCIFGGFLMLSAFRFYRSGGYNAQSAVNEVAQSSVVKAAGKAAAETATQAVIDANTSKNPPV